MQLSSKQITFRYPCSKTLFQDIDFTLHSGEKICIFAKSGFGKSTFAKVLAGYETQTSGQVLLDEKPLPQGVFSPVQLIYQHPEQSVNPKWTVQQILQEGGDYDAQLLQKFGIDQSYLTRFPHELSGGELQRICIVRALKEPTKFLICDEITTMLDAITQANIWQCILEVAAAKKIGLLVITHNKFLADAICETVIDFEKLCARC